MAKVALLIGVSEYGAGLNPLPGAVKDVEAIREVLLHSDIGGFASGDVKLLKNPQRQEMEEAIESLFSGRQKDDLVLLYFSGHGIKDDTNRLYLTTRTTRKTERGELIRSTAVAASFVHDSMGRSRSKRQVVVLDSCFSGAFAEGLLARDDGSVDIRTELGGEGRAVLTSSTSTQYSFEEKGEDLSIYTRFLLEGIRTGAADLDDDGVISIDELHEYASRKVQEFQPTMKPELYAIREGFKIRLTKVPPGDPLQKYRKEVARFIHRGEISFVGRRTLDVLRSRLALEPTAAQAIEDEVLEPCRQEFHNKLQQYEQVFTEELQRDQTITESDRADLQNLQQILGLRNEDTVPIEAAVTARLKTHQKNLQTYEQTFGQTLRQEFPLSDASRTRLAQLKRQLELADAEVLPIETRITAEVESFHQNLQQYEQLFEAAIHQNYPLSDETRNELQQQQESLGLSKVDVAPIEAKITTEIETYQQKLQQYEQAYVNATQHKYHLSESDRKQLEQTWQTLGLREEDVRAIAAQINAQVESYQVNLRQYEHEFVEATDQQYPLSEAKRRELKQRQQALNLSDKDVRPIEFRIIADIEERQQKIQQYEQVFAESIQYEYPLTEETRKELKRFQQVLELSNETVVQIEERIIASKETDSNSKPESPATELQAEEMNTEPPEYLPLTRPSTQAPSTPVKRPDLSPAKPKLSNPSQPIDRNRRQVLQWLGFGSGGLALALVGQKVFNSPAPQSPILGPIVGEAAVSGGSSPAPASGGTIKVGVLHSLSGTMAISEKSVVDSTLLAIEEINAAGGVGGKKIEAIQEDGASDWITFAEKAKKLIEQDQVVVIFGCWTSASRKAVLPVLEEKNHMLYYPMQYEGQECSKNIFYTGATPNQQIEPSVDWLLENKGKNFYLVGSDYVFPRTANTIIKAQLAAKGGKTVGEDYLPLGGTEVAPIIAKIKSVLPNGGVIYTTLNGDSNVAFFKQMQGAGLGPDKYPVMSVSIAEEEVKEIGIEFLKGHYAAWNYFMTVDSLENKKYVTAFKKMFGDDRVINDPMEAGYISVNIWKQAVEKAGGAGSPLDLEKVRTAAYGQTFAAPEGLVKMNNNHHLSKIVRIGEVRDDGLFEIVSATPKAVNPIPWNQFVTETKGYTCDWTKTNVKSGETAGRFKI